MKPTFYLPVVLIVNEECPMNVLDAITNIKGIEGWTLEIGGRLLQPTPASPPGMVKELILAMGEEFITVEET